MIELGSLAIRPLPIRTPVVGRSSVGYVLACQVSIVPVPARGWGTAS